MKKILERGWMMALAFTLVIGAGISSVSAQSSVSLQVFYDELQPYGTWMDYGNYGYVWIPRVDRSFSPYATNGYWINTEYGNTWVSDYSWGWAPFHYGRWLFDDFYGWIWVPDTEWGPAWVAWRSGGGYYGWAPLMPGFGIQLTFSYYDRIPHHYWNFVPYRYVTYRNVYRHCVPRPRIVNVYNHTTVITHNYTDRRRHTYFTGPSRNEIEKRGGGRVVVHQVNEVKRPARTEVSRNTANFYRPEIESSRDSRSRSVPATYVKRDRSGNLEKVETRNSRPTEIPAMRKSDDVRNDPRSYQRTAPQQRRENPAYEGQRSEYRPSQRTRELERQMEMPARTDRPQQRENNVTRERSEAPAVKRAPQNPTMQQRSSQPQQWQQKNTGRQRESPTMQRQGTSYRENGSRSTTAPSQRSMQLQKSESGSRSNATRKRN